MDKVKLRKAAEVLGEELERERDLPSSMAGLRNFIEPLIDKALRMEIQSPVDENTIPGAYQFNEGDMRGFPELEEAYVEFRVQLSGGVSSTMQSILDSMDGKN